MFPLQHKTSKTENKRYNLMIESLLSTVDNKDTKGAMSGVITVDFTEFDFPAKKICLHLLHLEKDWVEFPAVHKLFNKNGPFGPSFRTIFPSLMTMIIEPPVHRY